MTSWANILAKHRASGGCSVLLTVAAARGSTPRELGARMLVTSEDTIGTIGGGALEYRAVQRAQEMLSAETDISEILQLPLGPELAQCCGGHVDVLVSPLTVSDLQWLENILQVGQPADETYLHTSLHEGQVERRIVYNKEAGTTDDNTVLIEPLDENHFHLALFGAGHVGKAVIQVLASYPCTISWIDERDEIFPDLLPDNVTKYVSPSPELLAATQPVDSYHLVMTHSHQRDLEICEAVLKHGNFGYLGLIGSETKRKKFEKRLQFRGMSDASVADMTCPIGLTEMRGKHPAEIAISVAAELLQIHQRHQIGISNVAPLMRQQRKK
ncbi:MAG: xanthine dehydrogenase accessory protein XdhC [Sneathiella sp.]